MTNEARLHDALNTVLPAYHLALDGEPAEGAAYRFLNETHLYESDIPVMTTEHFQIYIGQRGNYSAELVAKARQSLTDAGFTVTQGGQSMLEDYYRDELRASRKKEE